MHIDSCTTRTKNGKLSTRHLIRESYRENGRVKKRTIANISHCSEDEVNAIRLALQHKDDLSTLGSAKDSVSITQGLSVGAVVTVYQVAKQLGIVNALGSTREGKLALWQIIARVIDQGSRLSAVRLATRHAACEVLGFKKGFTEDDLYPNLSWLLENQVSIEDRLYKKLYGKGKSELFLYDVTSTYLEGQQNALGAFGYNRDKKRGKKQIVIGLMCDAAGEALSIEAFRGNTSDTKTFGSQVDKIAGRFGGESVTLVGDRGMIKGPQCALLDRGEGKEPFHYITAITKPQIESLLKTGLIRMSLFDEKVAEVDTNDGIRYVLKRNPVRAEEIQIARESKVSVLKQLLNTKNEYLKHHPKARVATAIKDIKLKIESLKLSWFSVTAQKRTLALNEDLETLEEKRKLDGCYVIKTDLSKDKASTQIVHDRYKDLALVEWAFRSSKTVNLEVRPVYVRCEASTRGHVFIVMLAYKIIKQLASCWKDFNITVEEGIDSLATLCAQDVKFKNSGTAFNQIPTPHQDLQRLIKAANVTLPAIIPQRTINVATRKSLVSERKS